MKQPTIAVIGTGAVGSTTAFSLLMQNIPAQIILIDINTKKCAGEVGDLEDVAPLTEGALVKKGTLQEAAQADIIVITAGIPQKPKQTRLDLIKTNCAVIESIMRDMKPINPKSIVIVVTNPVDILTHYVQQISGLPQQQIFGSGTLLDTNRLKGFLAEHLNTSSRLIQGYVLGEHGDSQVVAWSTVKVDGVPLENLGLQPSTLEELATKTKQKIYEIIECKGFTSFGVASCVAQYCKIILGDSKQIVPVSCFVKHYNVCFSMPVILGRHGIHEVVDLPLTSAEQKNLQESATALKKIGGCRNK